MKRFILSTFLSLLALGASGFTTNTFTSVDTAQVWAESAGPLKLFSLSAANSEGADRYLMLFATDSSANGDYPIRAWKLTNSATLNLNFFPDGYYVKSVTSAQVEKHGCTFWVSTTATTLTKSTGGGVTITSVKMAQSDLATVPIAIGTIARSISITVDTNGLINTPWGTISSTGTKTAGIQEAIDSAPKKTDIFNGTGGATIDLGSGFFNCTTQIVIPNYQPFYLRLRGQGMNNTFIRFQDGGTLTNKAFFTMATNNQTPGLTNMLTLVVEDCAFMDDNQFKTNYLWDITGDNFVNFYRCLFASTYALTNGNSAYTLNWEANVPNAPIGLCAFKLRDQSANCYSTIHSCSFYGLANGLVIRGVVCRVIGNCFSCIGIYNTTLPPFNNLNNIHYCTNLWRGNIDTASTDDQLANCSLSVGTAIVCDTPDSVFSENEFFGCGACFLFDTALGTFTEPCRLINNRYSICKYRTATWDLGMTCTVIESTPSTGGAPFPDTILTNSANVVQPNTIAPIAFPVLSYVMKANTPAHIFAGGRLIGDGSGLTNLPSSEVGVTDGSSATTGNVGEYINALKASGSAQALQSAVPTNITTISLTAGDWDVEGNASFVGSTATVTATAAGIVTTANTIPTDGSEVYSGVTVTLVSETDGVTLPRKRVSVSSTTTIYLTGRCTFTAGSVSAFGSINARRVR